MTRVGVFCLANCRRFETSDFDQALPVLRVDFVDIASTSCVEKDSSQLNPSQVLSESQASKDEVLLQLTTALGGKTKGHSCVLSHLFLL